MMARRKRSLPPYIEIGLTDEQVDQIVEETVEAALSGKGTWHYPQRGRPSLTGKAATSPHVGFRVSPELREQADALARRRGISLSQLAREALEQYVKGP